MTEICAAMGLANFEILEETIGRNRDNHRHYAEALASVRGIRVLPYDDKERCNYQYVVLEVSDECPVSRDDLVAMLHRENVLARRYFWPGAHRMKPYRDLYPHAGLMLPVTQEVAARVMVLPTGTAVSPEDIALIAELIAEAVTGA